MKRDGDSLLGLNYLRRYLATFDLDRNRLFLAPGFDFTRPEEQTKVGLSLLRIDSQTVVEYVDADSPAHALGLKEGDNLISIDGDIVAGKPLAEIRWTLITKVRLRQFAEVAIERKGVRHTLHLNSD